jgi:hypothetical protein|tara:strand:- start:44094 stop:44591 length:498 start_codon:yes stop_codon:yes gene_type:complete
MHRKIIKQIKMKIVWLVPVVISPLLLIDDLDTKNLITIITAIISFVYFVQKQSMEDDKLELEAFSSFNSRYFKLASRIELILNKDEGQNLTEEEKEILDEYFSLCVEEYFYFTKGRISIEIWRNWAHGISATVRSHELIQNYWNKTVRNKVNYGLTLKEVEKYLK